MEILPNDPPHSWRYGAKCAKTEVYDIQYDEDGRAYREVDTEIFFPPRDKAQYKPIADRAKAICLGNDGFDECPVRLHCLNYAFEIDEQHGIFGGMSHRERNALLRRKAKTHPDLSLKDYLWMADKKAP